MAIEILINIGSGNGLLLDGTKPLPKPIQPIISEVLWHSLGDSLKENAHDAPH